MITIVIPSRTDDYLDELLASIEISQPGWLARRADFGWPGVTVVDNGLSEAFRERWRQVVYFVRLDSPFVFSKAMNTGVAKTHPESGLLLMNDDTRVLSRGFIDVFEAWTATQEAPKYGIISPVITGGVGNSEQKAAPPDGQVREIETTVCFVCVFIPRSVWDTVGPMDESFTGYGNDDDDWNHRARLEGFKCGVLGGVTIEHGRPQSFSMSGTYARVLTDERRVAESRENQRIFVQKWGGTPEGLRRLRASEEGPNSMTLWEFVELGYLQEMNRQFLHPLGLSMVVRADPLRQRAEFGGITDDREDPEGLVFEDGVMNTEKSSRILEEQRVRREAREKGLGFWVQPPPAGAE